MRALSCSRVAAAIGGPAAAAAQFVVDPAVRFAGAVVGYRDEGVEFAAQLAELAMHGPDDDGRAARAPGQAARFFSCSSWRRCSRARIWSASSNPGMPR